MKKDPQNKAPKISGKSHVGSLDANQALAEPGASKPEPTTSA